MPYLFNQGMWDMQPWIFLSPHLDDVVLSCGGLIASWTGTGVAVQAWTVCAGDPPDEHFSEFAQSLHERWLTGRHSSAARREEDRLACARIGAQPVHFSLPDCIYRRNPQDGSAIIQSRDDLFNPIQPAEMPLVDELANDLSAALHERHLEDAFLVAPLTLGGHVDHRITRAAAERLGKPLAYYPDFPYAVEVDASRPGLIDPGWAKQAYPATQQDIAAWQDAVGQYASQISTFWSSQAEMRAAIRAYQDQGGGYYLWHTLEQADLAGQAH